MTNFHSVQNFLFRRTITIYIRLELKKSENFHKNFLNGFLRILNRDGSYTSDPPGNRRGGN
jgi:hypothetical protein